MFSIKNSCSRLCTALSRAPLLLSTAKYNHPIMMLRSFWCSNRSICYLRLGCADKAIADADEAIRLKPEWQKP